VEQDKADIARQWHDNHISAAVDSDTTTEDEVFYAVLAKAI
jgi:hypothetical protein